MVKAEEIAGKEVCLCEVCGFGYADHSTAEACEEYCTANNSCSLEITRKAVYKPS
jgi:hypothetical protein